MENNAPSDLPPGFTLDQAPVSQPIHAQPQAIPQQGMSDLPPGFIVDEPKSDLGATIGAGVEGLARGVLGPVAPFLERAAGISGKEQRERAAAHPIASGVGEATGLLGGILTGTGEAALMAKAGDMAAHAVGLGELAQNASYISKVGSAAVKQAAEMAVLQSGDEIAKKIMQDPASSSESALAHIGLAAALGAGGGAFMEGAVSPLWKATIGDRLENGLKALTSRIGGVEGAQAQSTATELEAMAGVPIPPEIKSVIDDRPGMKETHSILSQSDSTIAGRKYQKVVNELHENLGSKVAESLGKTPKDIEKLPDLDKYTRGRDIGETLRAEIEPVAKSIGERYEKVTERFKNTPITTSDRQAINEKIAKLSLEKGWHKAESDAETKLADKVMEKIHYQTTADDLKKFITNLNDAHPYGSPTYQSAKEIKNILKDSQERILSDSIVNAGGDAVENLAEYNLLKNDYRNMMNKFDSLNEHLHVGRYDGPQSFLKALGDLSSTKGERVLERALGGKSADMLKQLEMFPETLNKVKQYHIDSLIDKASTKTPEGAKLNINGLIKNIESLSPQIKGLIVTPEQHQAIDAVARIVEGLKDPTHNWSNTGRTMSKLAHGTPSAISLLAMLTGHAEAGILTFLGKLGLNEGKDAFKLAMMKFLSSDKPIKAEGFKAMVNYMDSVYKAENLMTKATKNVFKPGAQILLESQIPTAKEIARLDKMVAKQDMSAQDPMLDARNSNVGHYMDTHQASVAKISIRAKQYLQTIKPQPFQAGPLDKPIEPSKMEIARYNRALEIAEQPAVVLQHIKSGTLLASDQADLQAMYPQVYANMAQKLTNEMINRKADDEPIPYKVRIGISLFLGQPLDSSMTATSIQAAQPQPKQPPQPGQQQEGGKAKKSANSLSKMPKSYRTPNQTSEADRADRD